MKHQWEDYSGSPRVTLLISRSAVTSRVWSEGFGVVIVYQDQHFWELMSSFSRNTGFIFTVKLQFTNKLLGGVAFWWCTIDVCYSPHCSVKPFKVWGRLEQLCMFIEINVCFKFLPSQFIQLHFSQFPSKKSDTSCEEWITLGCYLFLPDIWL